MKTPKPPAETEEQKQVRLRAETDNVRSIQETVQQRTSLFQRLMSPRVSLVTGKAKSAVKLMG
jgi:hypothetical protein